MGSDKLDWEKRLKIHTFGRDASNSDNYRYPYEPTNYCVLERLANSNLIGKKNTMIDYGCGKGRVGFFMSFQTGCRTIGIEFDERLYQKAEQNKHTAVSGQKVELLLENAEEHIVEEKADRFYFFNPFSIEIFQSVLGKIMDSYYHNPREMFLFFYYPSDEYVAFLMTVPELEFYDDIDCRDLFLSASDREKILVFTLPGIEE